MSYLQDFVNHSHTRLLAGADAWKARQHLRARSFTAEDVQELRIGWAPQVYVTIPNEVFEFYNCLIFPSLDDEGVPYAFAVQEIKP